MLQGHLPTVAQFLNSTPVGQAEVEVRFGEFIRDGFSASVPFIYYERLQKRLEAIPLPYTKEISTVEIDKQGVRRITSENQVIYQQKIRARTIDLPSYNLRLSLAVESPITNVSSFTPTTTRERIRTSYYYNDFIRVDCTEVVSTRNQQSNIIYEVEVEFSGVPNQLEIFNCELEIIYKYYRGTAHLYTQDQITTLLSTINAGLGTVGTSFNRKTLVNARNLHRRDLVYGGIVGNPNTRYLITYKADGYRKLLVVHNDGIWLIYPPYEFNLVLLPSTSARQQILEALSGTLLDGELVSSNKSDITYRFLAFDILLLRNSQTSLIDVRSNPYVADAGNARKPLTMGVVNVLTNVLGNIPLQLEVKPSSILSDVATFFKEVRHYFRERRNLTYFEDGLIFLPADTGYMPTSNNLIPSDQLPLSQRVLTSVPDICKWKPSKKITNDFYIQWLPNNQLQLLVYDPAIRSNVVFTGTRINPLDPSIIDTSSRILYLGNSPLPTGTIVEFCFDPSIPILQPVSVRHDKSGANQLAIAQDNWDMAHNPIDLEELTGYSLRMAFTYHNQIKRELYRQVGEGKTLLDIGSGRGGDLSKWLKYRRIVAVEPDASNAAELRLRLSRMASLRDRVLVVDTGGEDTSTITQAVQQFIGGRVDVVSFMLSLSFFWQSAELLQALSQTILNNIRADGTILFLTIDGHSLRKSLGNRGRVDIGPASFKWVSQSNNNFGQAIDVVLPDTIVEEQREYLVFLEDLTQLLPTYELIQYQKADTEKLLSETDMEFSSLYSYGYYQGTQQGELPIEDIPIEKLRNLQLDRSEDTRSQTISEDVASGELPVEQFGKLNLSSVGGESSDSVSSEDERLASGEITGGPACVVPEVNVLTILQPRDGAEVYEPITTSWYDNLVRIATIGDSNCFVHGLLLGFAHNYQKLTTITARRQMAAEIRRDLAAMLGKLDQQYPRYVIWEVTARGQYINLLISELESSDLVEVLGIDYSLRGLQYALNSSKYLGEEFVDLCSRVLRVNIYLLRASANDLHVHSQTYPVIPEYPHVVLIGGGCHWELLGLKENNQIITAFASDSNFIIKLQNMFNRCGINDLTVFDPKANYFKLFAEIDYSENFLRNLSQLSNNEPLVQRLLLLKLIERNEQGLYQRTSIPAPTF